MTDDPITAALQQLADHHEQLTQLTELITGIGDTLREHADALARLAETTPADADPDRYRPSPPPAWWKLAAAERQEPIARLHAWVQQVYQPGYGHLAATLGPCWQAHDLCLYGLDIAVRPVVGALPAAPPHDRDALGPGRIPGPHPARPGRPAPARNIPLRPPAHPSTDHRLSPARVMTDATLRQALAYARHGWPVFPCLPGEKIPATAHGFRDATTDEQQITEWFGRGFTWNLAIATGAPGPDVLDVDQHGEAGNGYPAFGKLERAGLVDGASAYVRTPAGGMHAYFTGTGQHNGRLPSHHLDFRSTGGYVLAPPSQVDGKPYRLIKKLGGHNGLDWTAVTALLEPQRHQQPPAPGQDPDRALSQLARWVASQPEGNRNSGLYWAANRALDADPAADLSSLAAAARQVGLDEPEITRTLDSARKTSQARNHQAEGVN